MTKSLTSAEFERHYRAWHEAVLRWAKGIMRDDHAGEDAAQSAWLRAWQYRDRFDGERSFGSWLKAILRRVCWRMMNPQKPEVATDALDAMHPDDREAVEPIAEAGQDAHCDALALADAIDNMTMLTGRGGVRAMPATPGLIATGRMMLAGLDQFQIAQARGVTRQSVRQSMDKVIAALRRKWSVSQ